MRRLVRALVERLANHDNNAERQYLAGEQRRITLAYSLHWLEWSAGVGAAHDPWPGAERWSAWAHVGPLSVEVFTAAVPA